MNAKQRKAFVKRAPGLVYEYTSKAMPMGVNGYPMFTSCHVLTAPETEEFGRLVQALITAMENVK